MHAAVWTAADASNPLAARSHPLIPEPIPLPTFIPKEVQEYIDPSSLVPFFSLVYSAASATNALKVPAKEQFVNEHRPYVRNIRVIFLDTAAAINKIQNKTCIINEYKFTFLMLANFLTIIGTIIRPTTLAMEKIVIDCPNRFGSPIT